MPKILIVDDDSGLSESLSRWLQKQGNTVETASCGQDALQMLQLYKYDVIVLDWELPDLSGLDVLKSFRGSGGITPIIFLTGKSELGSKMQGLDTGADDYLVKPFDLEELAARIRSLLRRPAGLLPNHLNIGNLSVEVLSQRVFLEGQQVKLGKKEYAVLYLLMRHPNRCFSSRELLESVWTSDTESSEDAVRACIRQLRGKITSPASGQCILDTVHGIGYTIKTD